MNAMKTEQQEQRAEAERLANHRAALEGLALPYPNLWDRLDPSKVRGPATDEIMQASYAEFRKLSRPRPRKQHRL